MLDNLEKLSPLDAFKARGKALHEQLKREQPKAQSSRASIMTTASEYDNEDVIGRISAIHLSSSDVSYTTSPARSALISPERSNLRRKSTERRKTTGSRLASKPDHTLQASEHIELGIEQHEHDQLPQSTHHFKVAADLGDPTGCMLYGLALRHGWGCRVDLPRSMQYLRQAADASLLELRTKPMEDIAVAVYELAVSYQNGWGVAQDRKASLRYFELAASWGDVEAMAAAADCYLHGRGCSKDKKKAAGYLRKAESKGRKEVGDAWIWKSKYDQ